MSDNIEDPKTWLCLGTNYKQCKTCLHAMKRTADCHVIPCYIDGKLDSGTKKVPKISCMQFCGIVNALLNILEGGTICVHLNSSLHGQFLQQTASKLRDLLPTGSVYSNTYAFVKEMHHIYFSVLPAGRGGRRMSTFDFKVKFPRTVGLEAPSQGEISTCLGNVLSVETQHYPHMFEKDPNFIRGRVLPGSFGENMRRQIKAVCEKDIEKAAGSNRAEKFANHTIRMIIGYICTFAMDRGGCIYLGLGEEKKSHSCGSSEAKEDDLVCTDRYRCDGIQLDEDEMNVFTHKLQVKLNTQMLSDPETQNLFDKIIKVEFLVVKDKEDCDTDSRVVKISVTYFHGILCPDASGPLAFKVKGGGGRSEVVRVPYFEWKSVFSQPGMQIYHNGLLKGV